MVHRLEGDLFQYAIPRDRLHNDAETRYIDDILRIVIARNDAPLSRRREPGERFVGICRDFALLHCSFLRHVGIPARIRSGFADYFGEDGFHFDHVVTEYWDPARLAARRSGVGGPARPGDPSGELRPHGRPA